MFMQCGRINADISVDYRLYPRIVGLWESGFASRSTKLKIRFSIFDIQDRVGRSSCTGIVVTDSGSCVAHARLFALMRPLLDIETEHKEDGGPTQHLWPAV